jgi:hypothetical protein
LPDNAGTTSTGFRLRGLQTTRIETFTDAAFAFALTLLVISLDPPTDMAALNAALTRIPVFVLSAGMLMMFWWAHHEWSRRYGLDDFRTFLLTCALVFTVLVYVYPLRFMFGAMMSWIGGSTGLPLQGSVAIAGPEDVNRLFAVYGVGFVAMAASVLALYLHAWSRRTALALDSLEVHETRAAIGAWAILTATGVISTVVALTVPATMAGLPGWVYASLGVLMPIYGWYMQRERRRLQPAPLTRTD